MARYTRENQGNVAALQVPEKLADWGHLVYRPGRAIAILILVTAAVLALIDGEPLFQRTTTVIILGIIPASLIWVGTIVVYRALRDISAVYRSTSMILRRHLRKLVHVS
jgi:hypothetical protein